MERVPIGIYLQQLQVLLRGVIALEVHRATVRRLQSSHFAVDERFELALGDIAADGRIPSFLGMHHVFDARYPVVSGVGRRRHEIPLSLCRFDHEAIAIARAKGGRVVGNGVDVGARES